MSDTTMAAEIIQALAKQIEELNKTAGTANTGACLISTPGNPRPTCVQMTPQQCSAIKGVYVGGKCP